MDRRDLLIAAAAVKQSQEVKLGELSCVDGYSTYGYVSDSRSTKVYGNGTIRTTIVPDWQLPTMEQVREFGVKYKEVGASTYTDVDTQDIYAGVYPLSEDNLVYGIEKVSYGATGVFPKAIVILPGATSFQFVDTSPLSPIPSGNEKGDWSNGMVCIVSYMNFLNYETYTMDELVLPLVGQE